jgi:hypothetical protein
VRTVQPTIDYASPSSSSGEPPPSSPASLPLASGQVGASPRVEVLAGSAVHLSEVTRSLLQVRLRAVALAMSCAFGAFLVRGLWIAGHYLDPFLLTFHAAVVAAFVASFGALSGRRPIDLRRLRTLDLVLFGMTITFFVTIHYRLIQLRVAEGDRVMLMATVKNTVDPSLPGQVSRRPLPRCRSPRPRPCRLRRRGRVGLRPRRRVVEISGSHDDGLQQQTAGIVGVSAKKSGGH